MQEQWKSETLRSIPISTELSQFSQEMSSSLATPTSASIHYSIHMDSRVSSCRPSCLKHPKGRNRQYRRSRSRYNWLLATIEVRKKKRGAKCKDLKMKLRETKQKFGKTRSGLQSCCSRWGSCRSLSRHKTACRTLYSYLITPHLSITKWSHLSIAKWSRRNSNYHRCSIINSPCCTADVTPRKSNGQNSEPGPGG